MRRSTCGMVVIGLLIAALPARSDDQQKAEKQVRRITAMAVDITGRRMVSKSLAESLKLPRVLFVQERKALNLSYGSLFVMHQLTAGGADFRQLAAQLKAGKNVWDAGNALNTNWRQIAAEAKRFNDRVDDNIYKHFTNEKNSKADDVLDAAEGYDAERDRIRPDMEVLPEELSEAERRYIFWRDQASQRQDAKLDTMREQVMRQGHDPVRDAGPHPDQVGSNTKPPQ